MAELRNCPSCDAFFNYTGVRDVCHACALEEEKIYEVVYRFLRKRENRAATVDRIEEATGASKELLYKWVRKGKLHPAVFPNLGYPCDNCGALTTTGKLCEKCSNSIKMDLNTVRAAEEFRENIRSQTTYHSEKK